MSAPVPVRHGLFADGDPPRLLCGRCAACGHPHFPRHDTCPYCASDDTVGTELSSEGRLWAWTAVTSAPPGYLGEVPYGFGVVELPEGLRVVTPLTEAHPDRLAQDQPMRLVVVSVPVDADRRATIYAFAPVDATVTTGAGSAAASPATGTGAP